MPNVISFVILHFCSPIAVIAHSLHKSFVEVVIGITSRIIEVFLAFKHPLPRHNGPLQRSLPSCPYRFPNGQGDVGKFLEGEKNSERWGQEHGSVYRIWSGTTPEIVLTKPEDVKTVFRDSNTHIKAVNNNTGWLMSQLLGSCLGLVSGQEWQTIRSSTGACFTKPVVSERIDRIESLTREYFAMLQQGHNLSKSVLDPIDDLRLLPFWIVADHLYGALDCKHKAELEKLIPLREELFRRCIHGGVTRFSWSRYLPTKTNRSLTEFRQRWHRFNDSVYAAQTSAQKESPIVGMYHAAQSGEIQWECLYQTLDEMLFANLDVTIGAISWNVMMLAANQTIQDEIRREVSKARLQNEDEKWRQYLWSSTSLLGYSILESARLKPLAAFTVPQAALTSPIVSGYRIYPKTNYVVDTYAINIKNKFWGNKTSEYQPQRFSSIKTSERRWHLWRFGFGPRQCLGKYLAEIMMRVLLAYLVANYRLSLQEDSSWTRNPETWIMQSKTEVKCECLDIDSC